jgi:hypothetical protein
MAAPTITAIGSAGAVGSGPGFTTGATITGTTANNDWFVVLVSSQPNASISGVTDSAGNTYTQRVNTGFDTGIATVGARLWIYTAPVTSNITNGTVTVTFSFGSMVAVYRVYRVRPASGTITFIAADAAGPTGSATNHAAATVSVTNGNTIFGAASIETNDAITGDSDTASGSWSTVDTVLVDSGSDPGSQSIVSQYKTVNATGNQSWTCSTTSARNSARSYLVLKGESAAFSLVAAQGQYLFSGTAVTMRLGNAPLVAGAGSYALTGTAATPKLGRVVAAAAGSYSFLGTDANTLHGWKVVADVGSYALTGTDAIPFKTAVAGKTLPAAAGFYALTGTDASAFHIGANVVAGVGSYALTGAAATLTHGYRIAAGDESGGVVLGGAYVLVGSTANLNASTGNKTASVDPGSYVLTGTATPVLHAWRIAAGDIGLVPLLDELGDPLLDELGNPLYAETGQITGGTYDLTGTDVALTTSTVNHFTITVESGSYLLTGTEATLRSSAQPAASPLHIGEWPVDKRKRRAREDAQAKEQRARKRFRDAIGRLLEGLPPEFDEPEQLAEAEVQAVQALNLLKAMYAPQPELDAVSQLIDHIRQLRIAQPIAQLHLAQAYNQAHRHLVAKAQEDATMALLLGE